MYKSFIMKLNQILLGAAFFFFSATTFAQQSDTIKICINDKLVGQQILKGQSEMVTNVSLGMYKSVTKLMVGVNCGSTKNSVFKRALEIMNDKDSVLLHVNETATMQGCFTINIAKAKAIVKGNKDVKIYYTEDPKNPRMMVRSMRKLIATLHFQ
jgi:hypothetical protein